MTLFVYVGGVDVSGSIRLEGGIAELTEAADGEPNECQLTIDDPTGVMTFTELAAVIVTETACSQPRCYTGIVTKAVQRRGPFRNGAGRVWDLSITDLNERLHRRVLYLASAKRPAETGTARLTWLLASGGLSGLVWNNGKVMANAWNYDATDYRQSYADDVLASVVDAASAGRWTAFAYWDPSAPSGQEPSLFYGEVTTTTFDSTLSISNVLADVNNTTVFAPAEDSEVTADGAPIYDGVLVVGPFGQLYRQLASTYATFAIHRDAVYETIRNNNLTSASLHADAFLAKHAGQVDTIGVTVTLPRDKVNLIAAGMRIAVKFSHLAGYTTSTYTRVTRRTFTFTEGTNEYYDVHLELSTRGIDQDGGGGNPGDFPHQPPGSAINYAEGSFTFVIDGTGSSAGAGVPTPFGASSTTSTTNAASFQIVDGSSYDWSFTLHQIGADNPPDAGFHLLAGTDAAHLWDGIGGGTQTQTGTFLAIATRDVWIYASSGADGHIPHTIVCDWVVNPVGWDAGTTPTPPLSGQEVIDETPTPAPGGGNRVFYTVYPYATASLRVFVDHVEQSAAVTETDPATGKFTMAFDPRSWEQLLVSYQGI